MNCTYSTDMQTGRTIYGQRRKQPAGLASYQARKAAQEAAALAPYSVEKESIYSSAPWIVKFDGKAIGEFFPTKKAAVAWIEQKKQEKAPAQAQEKPENHSETKKPDEKKEEKTMKKVEFTPAAIIVNGQEYAARYEYGETPKNHYRPTIRVYTELSGNACIVELPDDDAEYDNARAAMEQEQPAQAAETPAQEQPAETSENHSEPEQEQPAQAAETPAAQEQEQPAQAEQEQPAETPAQEQEKPDETPENHSAQEQEQPARNPKEARGPVPEKTFIGTKICGTGYSIIFDGGCNRTRVIVTDDVKEKARPIIEKAGFYYSAALDSWNKKLTFRAYRAAQELAAELNKALAA